jgi:adenine/guanine phosphoribosyltransferase-like PRPP-binding protein
MAKRAIDFREIRRRLKRCELPEVDRVVGIGSGGIVPAALVAYELDRRLSILMINYRDPDNIPRYGEPRLLAGIDLLPPDDRLLLVDDVSVSGRTIALAKEELAGHPITTLVLKGQADIVLFPEVAECVAWPWLV